MCIHPQPWQCSGLLWASHIFAADLPLKAIVAEKTHERLIGLTKPTCALAGRVAALESQCDVMKVLD